MEITVKVNLLSETCCACAVVFAIPDYLQERRKEDGKLFYCPNGHGQHYAVTEIQKLQSQLARVQADADREAENSRYWQGRMEEIDRSRSAIKGQVTKLKNRIQNGVCPCCNRMFRNLHRHMADQHPNFATIEVTK